jgi:hypothetical protein
MFSFSIVSLEAAQVAGLCLQKERLELLLRGGPLQFLIDAQMFPGRVEPSGFPRCPTAGWCCACSCHSKAACQCAPVTEDSEFGKLRR